MSSPNQPNPLDGGVLETKPPALTLQEAEEIGFRAFNIQATATPLDSERDQNFRLQGADGAWVLKIANPAEDSALLEMQTEALLHIAAVDPELAVPRVIPAVDGSHLHLFEGRDGQPYRARLLSYLPGQLLGHAVAQPALVRNVGIMTARLARALRSFFHPAARYELLWDLMQAGSLQAVTHHIPDSQQRKLIEEALGHFGADVLPRLQKQRAQIIHNDVSELNVLVNGNEVTGVIDFGDLIYAPLICDLAVPISELMATHPYPLATAAEITAGYHSVTPLEDEELRLIFDLVSTRCAMVVAIAHWRVSDHPENRAYIMAGAEEAAALLKQLKSWGAEQMLAELRRACGKSHLVATPTIAKDLSNGEPLQPLLDRRRKVLGPALELSYSDPVHMVRGEGVWLIDASGRSILDGYNNVPSVGHCHPHVVQAIAEQAATLNTNTRYLHQTVVAYAERLVAKMPGDLSICMFVCSGSEANDLAWRLAKAHTGQGGGIVMEDAYHGTTDAVYELSPAEYGVERGRVLAEHIALVPAPDGYRGIYRREEPDYVHRYVACFDDAINTLDKRGHAPAAFFIDPILSSNGIIVPPPGYLPAAFEKVRAAGGLCVADEVQSGFGRMGDTFWGFEAHGVIPDIVTLGKPIGNGLSMAAVITTPTIVASLMQKAEFFSTTGGNPVSAAAGLAVLNVMEHEGLQAKAATVGRLLRLDLKKLAERHPLIGEVRGSGMFVGVELVRDHITLEPAGAETSAVANRMRELGVLVGTDGPNGNVLKIRPPLVFNENHAMQLVAVLDQALHEL